MQLTLNALTALRLTRAIRTGAIPGNLSARCDLHEPDPGPTGRWSSRALQAELDRLGAMGSFSPRQPLHALVKNREDRLQVKGVHCASRATAHPDGSFVDLGQGLAMSSPELLFVELAEVMEPAVHLLLGMELCGRYSRDALSPRNGPVAYDLEPVTSVERLRAFAREASGIRGMHQAMATIDRIVENAWSPMEALLAALIVLPAEEFGYDLWPIVLNPRKEADEHLRPYVSTDSRVPDIVFSATSVGLNYDGEDHFGLRRIAAAATAAAGSPGDAHLAREVEDAIADARQRIVGDKRRDRDLETQGYVVLPVTKEDFSDDGGIDHVMGQVVEAIEREGTRRLGAQRELLKDKELATKRQLFIWSLMPGRTAAGARQKLQALVEPQAQELAEPQELVEAPGQTQRPVETSSQIQERSQAPSVSQVPMEAPGQTQEPVETPGKTQGPRGQTQVPSVPRGQVARVRSTESIWGLQVSVEYLGERLYQALAGSA